MKIIEGIKDIDEDSIEYKDKCNVSIYKTVSRISKEDY